MRNSVSSGERLLCAALLLLGPMAVSLGTAAADEIIPPTPLQQMAGSGVFLYRLDKPATGQGDLDIEWRDVLGRVADRRRIPLKLAHASEIRFRLDLRRAVTTKNELRARLTLAGTGEGGTGDRRVSEQQISFFLRPSGDPWSNYNVIMWQPQKAEHCGALREIGINAGTIIADDKDDPAQSIDQQISSLLDCGLGWYVENIATDFYSAYHRWSPNHPVNWRFVESKKAYQENPRDLAAFMREPSLSDPNWQRKIRDRLMATVRAHRRYRPLFYDLGDETGIADLSAFWDFDFSSYSLAEMRRWLKERYRSLVALNRQWGTRFGKWDAVMPMTTAQAMKQLDQNYSAWADFKAWMDVAFAQALKRGTRAVHAADRTAYAAIEGGQIPGWGGYDYSRLATAVDLMEFYDGGGNVEIARALNPNLVLLTTSANSGALEAHDIWRALLRGSRGVIFWDPNHGIVGEDGGIGQRGRDVAEPVREIKAGLGALLSHSHRQTAPVAILYSPASMRTQWMLDWQPKGDGWSDRDANSDYEDESAVRSSMAGFFSLMAHMGLEPRVVVSDLIEKGGLRRGKFRVLILPRAIALSEAEALEIRRFVAEGGTVIADGEPGQFDQHSRRMPRPLLAKLFQTTTDDLRTRFSFGQGRAIYVDAQAASDATPVSSDARNRILQTLAEAGITPTITVSGKNGERVTDIETYVWRNGDATIIALQRDLPAAAAEGPGRSTDRVIVTLPQRAHFYDLRARKPLGETNRLELAVDPIVPAILAVSAQLRSSPTISGPKRVFAGATAKLTFNLPADGSVAVPVLHVDVVDPRANIAPHYSGDILLHGDKGSKQLNFAFNDIAGTWRVRATDVLTGNAAAQEIEVLERRLSPP